MNSQGFLILGICYTAILLAANPVTRMLKLLFIGLGLVSFGMVASFTAVGPLVGIPVIITGALLLFIHLLYHNLSKIFFH